MRQYIQGLVNGMGYEDFCYNSEEQIWTKANQREVKRRYYTVMLVPVIWKTMETTH